MATTELKTLEKLVKEILEKIKGIETTQGTAVQEGSKLEIVEKLDTLVDAATTSKELIKKVDKLNTKVDKKAKEYVKELENAFEKYQQKRLEVFAGIENPQASDIKDFVSIITNEIFELKEKFETFNTEFTDINLNTNMAISKEIVSMKNCVLSLNDSIDAIKVKVEDFKPDTTGLTNNISELFTSTLNTFKNDTFAVLAKISQGITKAIDNAKFFEGIEISLGEILKKQQQDKDDIIKIIKADIASENKQLLPQILQIINSISFGEDAEEIKDCIMAVNENLGVVNKNTGEVLEQISTLKQTINENANSKNDVLEQMQKINEDVSSTSKGMLEKIQTIDSTIGKVSSEFTTFVHGTQDEGQEYLYSLLDLESDISKVRILLDDLVHSIRDDKSLAEAVTQNISDKIANVNKFVEKTTNLMADPDYKELLLQFDALNDDITSISKRTNKLILTSDDSSVKLEKNITDFQNILNKISTTVKNFENATVFKNISIKADNITKMMQASLQSSNATNEAFIHLATWIDDTSEQISSMKDEISTISQQLTAVASDSEVTTSEEVSPKLEKLLKETNKKLTENTKRIDALEENLNSFSEMKTMIEFVAAQVQTTNETLGANKTLNKKIDKMEKQIQQLLSYVDEDE